MVKQKAYLSNRDSVIVALQEGVEIVVQQEDETFSEGIGIKLEEL